MAEGLQTEQLPAVWQLLDIGGKACSWWAAGMQQLASAMSWAWMSAGSAYISLRVSSLYRSHNSWFLLGVAAVLVMSWMAESFVWCEALIGFSLTLFHFSSAVVTGAPGPRQATWRRSSAAAAALPGLSLSLSLGLSLGLR